MISDDYWTEWFDVSTPANSNGNDDIELRSNLNNNVSTYHACCIKVIGL